MKLDVFHAGKGDSILLTGKDGKRILVDGGVGSAFTNCISPSLNKLQKAKKEIDVVYVSHIDDDHIGGILRYMDDLVAWAIFDHKKKNGASPKEPKSLRPPDVGEIWSNGFRDIIGDNAGPIEDQLAANALVLSGFTGDSSIADAVAAHQDIAASIPQAIKLAKRIQDGVLGIPHNRPAKGKLMMVKKGKPVIKVGAMEVRLLGPFEEDLKVLRADWNAWLRKSQKALATIRAQSKRQKDDLTTAEGFMQPLTAEARELAEALLRPGPVGLAKTLGNRKEVTPPNLASLTLHVREGKQSVILTGDAHADEVLKGLRHHKLMAAHGGIHVNVLKVQHHGSEHNMTDEFASLVTADHYVFCGNGFSGNPEDIVIQRLADARLSTGALRSSNPEVSRPFTFWFNFDSKTLSTQRVVSVMKTAEQLAAKLVKQSKKQMKAVFLKAGQPSFQIAP